MFSCSMKDTRKNYIVILHAENMGINVKELSIYTCLILFGAVLKIMQ